MQPNSTRQSSLVYMVFPFFFFFFLREHACALSGPAMPAATATLYGQEISVFVGASLTDTETHSPIQGGTDEELDFAARE